jgi:hypothetical protein
VHTRDINLKEIANRKRRQRKQHRERRLWQSQDHSRQLEAILLCVVYLVACRCLMVRLNLLGLGHPGANLHQILMEDNLQSSHLRQLLFNDSIGDQGVCQIPVKDSL